MAESDPQPIVETVNPFQCFPSSSFGRSQEMASVFPANRGMETRTTRAY